ncbi:MAG: LysM peptidoglycan-binding domain-containing protein [Methylococcales bacterium]|nr:LysM peptidoglycan-binding domain-containing protein [Methylococcales bacterium]
MSHVIRSGDTLGEIAQRYNVTVAQILAANPRIRNANQIRVGQAIKIPGRKIKYTSNPKNVKISRKPKTTSRSQASKENSDEDGTPVSNVHTVKRGESLDKIARKYDLTVSKLLKLNPSIKNANRIRIGQKIIIPSPSLFTQIKDFFSFGWLHQSNKFVEINPYEVATENEISAADVVLDKDGSLIPDTTEITEEEQFNRKVFFTTYRKIFGSLKQHQVNGLSSLLDSLERDEEITDIQYMAYMLATVKHETANRFQPITEYGGRSYFNKYDSILANTSRRRSRAKRNGNTKRGDGYKYRGRGFVQITWQKNYKNLGDALGHDLVNNPEKALDPVIAYQIMSYGMRKGTFTGRRLSQYLSKERTDYRNARKIINGLDKANLIKRHAENFERILRKAVV